MKISKHCSLYEATRSQTATRLKIDNKPNDEQLRNMQLVANMCFEPIREHFGVPIFISSFLRVPKLNKAIGGSKTSDHQWGRAMDLDADVYQVEMKPDHQKYYGSKYLTNKIIFDWAKENLEFDQLISEFGTDENPAWVHISYRSEAENRNQVFRIGK